MRLKKLIKDFRFAEDVRTKITLGTDVRLNPQEHWLQLKADAQGAFPLTADLYAKTWIANPQTARQWLGFEAEVLHAKVDDVEVTSVAFRLSDGTGDYWWDGAAWDDAPAAGEWNTEIEIAANISTFPATAQKIQVIINLKTTKAAVTPKVKAVKVLYSSDVEFQEDIVYRSLVPALRSGVRPKGRLAFVAATTGSTFDLNDYPIDAPYDLVDVDSAFNHTDDPNHLTNILQSYNTGTKVVTLTVSVAAGKTVWLEFLYQPTIAVTTSQDYSEISKVPALVLDDINMVDSSVRGPDDSVVNRSDGTGVKVLAPLVGDLEILLHLITSKGIDIMRLADEVKRYFENNPLLTAVGVDEQYRLWVVDEFDMTTAANRGDIHSGRLRFRVVGVRYYLRDAVDTYAVEQFKITGDMNVTIPT